MQARWLLLLGFWITSFSVYCQQICTGTLVDKETRKPVPFASIGILGTSKGTSTNLDGQFSLAVTLPVKIKITCIGYESIVLNAAELPAVVELSPMTTHLNEVVVLAKAQNPRALVRKAFANIGENYSKESFLQTFFYRHYCKDDSVYGRLIEASVDVWKDQGYRVVRSTAGQREGIRVTQLRRSLDKTVMAQGHEPIAIGNMLQADIVGYQPEEMSDHLKLYDETINLRTHFDKYEFTLEGATLHDEQEVYKISYQSKPDSIQTTSGYLPATTISGTLYITMNNFAIIKFEDVKKEGSNTIRTSGYYRKVDKHYYPYHFVREGESRFADGHDHSFHIELMSVEIQHNIASKMTSQALDKESLLKIPYDSGFWKSHTVLKTTPLEDEIIHDLGGGRSLNNQFYRYQQYEWSTSAGSKNGIEKYRVLLNHSQGERMLFVGIINSQYQLYLNELEHFKKLSKAYRTHMTYVLIMIENDEKKWREVVDRYTLFADGIINYRFDQDFDLVKEFKVKETPAFLFFPKEGMSLDLGSKLSGNPLLEESMKNVIK